MAESYYSLNSSGSEINLQLFALRQAIYFWRALKFEVEEKAEDEVDFYRERCVVIVDLLGLSVSQLLGQNNVDDPPRKGDRIPSPGHLWKRFVENTPASGELRPRGNDVTQFFNAYDRIRHFGTSDGDWVYDEINQLDFPTTTRHLRTAAAIWRSIVAARRDELNLKAFVEGELSDLE